MILCPKKYFSFLKFYVCLKVLYKIICSQNPGHSPLPTPEVYRIRISGLESGRIQHILNKPDRIRPTVLFKFPDQNQDFQISLLWDLTPTQS